MSAPKPLELTGSAREKFRRGAIVVLTPNSGTAPQRKLVWRVTDLPRARAKRKDERTMYAIVPVTGGIPVRVFAHQLLLANNKVRDAYRDLEPLPELTAGMVCVPSPAARIPDADPFTEVVVTRANADGTVDIAALGGGRTWNRIPVGSLVRNNHA